MYFPTHFFRATDDYNTYQKHVAAPYIRKKFSAPQFKEAYLTISGLGFYEIYLNGKDITKGLLAPYISNPDDIVYFDRYNITDLLKGDNVVGIILGNGMQNASGGRVWDFDIARFRGTPRFAMWITYIDENGEEKLFFEADETFKCHPSPIIFDDLRSGCFYDANLECGDWLTNDFDDSSWDNVKPAETPRGDRRVCEADPVVVTKEIKPVKIENCKLMDELHNRDNMKLDTQFKFNKLGKEGVLFDFGVNTAGIFRLKVNGKKGQQIFIQFSEHMRSDGVISYDNSGSFYPDGYGQTALYICKGEENEVFTPSFCYYGYRYAVVFGLTEDQINEDALTMLVANSDIRENANFTCSDEIMNKLGQMSRVSDLANFYYFPTDCPHREKNGWTGDAAVSAAHMLLTLTPEKSYTEWLRNICKAQRTDGALPGIVPTGGWGFDWGNGPAWDNVLTELCYQIYRYRGDLTPARECSESMLRYLSYISQKRREDGFVSIGLGDWLQPMREAGAPVVPLYITDSVITMYIAKKSYELFTALGLTAHAAFADDLYSSLRETIRKNCINFATMTVESRCQTAQAICIYYGVFDDAEKAKACDVLVKLIHEKDDHFDCGMIGMRVIFHVLSACGQGELAYRMITRTDYPSYGILIEQGLTSLPEDFLPRDHWDRPNSLNHHFMGDFTNWFIANVVGIEVNPLLISPRCINLKPDFISELNFAEGFYGTPYGKITVRWERKDDEISLDVDCPAELEGKIILPDGWHFVDETNIFLDGFSITLLRSGHFTVVK